MRFSGVVGLAVVAVVGSPAAADQTAADQTATDKAARADEAAAAGDSRRALALYKEALALEKSPLLRCNVGIAYYKLEDWPRAHLFLAMCLAHTSELDADAVSQMGRAYAFVESQLEASGYGRVTVRARPAAAAITASAFAADEAFPANRTIWLPHGTHTLTAAAPGHRPASRSIDVPAIAEVELELEPLSRENPAVAERAPVGLPEPGDGPDVDARPPTLEPAGVDLRPQRSNTPTFVAFGSAAAALAGGVTFHALALNEKSSAEEFPEGRDFNAANDRFARHRAVAIGLYAGAAVATAVGVYFATRGGDDKHSNSVVLGVSVTPGGAAAAATWRY